MGGLKYVKYMNNQRAFKVSHPTRDGWIEIRGIEGGLATLTSPIPHGMGGLKYMNRLLSSVPLMSHPTRDGWIEILIRIPDHLDDAVPSHTGWVD